MNSRHPILDLALLQTLAAVSQEGSLAKAAQRIGRTQSAVSLQIQRLEELLAVDLFDRSGRALVLTAAGSTMLGYAQRLLDLNDDAVAAVRGHDVAGQVSLGVSVDFEHSWLPKAMARFSRTHPRIQVDLRVARNSELEAAVANRELDIALIFSQQTKVKSTLIGTVPMAWIATPDFAPALDAGAPLPLLLLEGTCIFRTAALQALDDARMPWRLAVTSPSLGGLWATALAGMGVTVRSNVLVPAGLADVGARLGLPPLPHVALRLLESGAKASAPRATLRAVLTDLAREAMRSPEAYGLPAEDAKATLQAWQQPGHGRA